MFPDSPGAGEGLETLTQEIRSAERRSLRTMLGLPFTGKALTLTLMVSAFPVHIEIEASPRLNFSFQHNALPFLRRLKLRNTGDRDLSRPTLHLRAEPAWAHPLDLPLAILPAGGEHNLLDPPIRLDFTTLSTLSERLRGSLTVEVRAALTDGDAEPSNILLGTQTLPVEVYAFDEWTGHQTLPELIASFVTPNLSAIADLLGRASGFLQMTTGSGALDGYQQKSKARVYALMEAIFQAVRSWDIRYCEPPASFGESGQRVRFAPQIRSERLATCLDTALLFSAALEQAGLRPLLLFHEGHAYTGCWLTPDSLAEPVHDDLQMIRKHVELDDIAVFETTLACQHAPAKFGDAEAAARPHLQKDAAFQCAVDIYRSRQSGFLPLPLPRGDGPLCIDSAASDDSTPETAPATSVRPLRETLWPEAPEENPVLTRIDQWKQSLLDLTRRNRLLHFRETKQTIPLECPVPEDLESALAEKTTFQILPRSRIMSEADPRTPALRERTGGEEPGAAHLLAEFHNRRLRSSLPEGEWARRLLEIYRQARSELEESGANTLYLAIGFLSWSESSASERVQKAPILLLPVELVRPSVQQGFRLQRLDEDAMINVTLLEMLRRDFQLTIPGVNPPPEGESGVDVARVFHLFQQAIRDIPGWEVHKEVWLGRFSFNKFLLWKDLHDRMDLLTRNPVVDHLVHRPGQPFSSTADLLPPEKVDTTVHYNELFCPLSADSSQLAAIIDAARGQHFVLHGPPGTGKSQTITNLIAHCLSVGKRVLFVAEKKAALEVVHRRLTQIGLGPFCLELHSNRAGKAEVLQQFGEALDFGQESGPQEWASLADRLEKSRDELNGIVEALHQPYPNGLSAFQTYAWLIAHPEAKDGPLLDLDQPEKQSPAEREALVTIASDLVLRGSAQRLPPGVRDALGPVHQSLWTPAWEDDLLARTTALRPVLNELPAAPEDLSFLFPGTIPRHARRVWEGAAWLANLLPNFPSVPATFITAPDWEGFYQEVGEWIRIGQRRDHARAALADFDREALLAAPLESLFRSWSILAGQTGLFIGLKRWWWKRPLVKMRLRGSPPWEPDEGFFQQAITWQKDERRLAEAPSAVTGRLGAHWADGEADWTTLTGLMERGASLQQAILTQADGHPDRLTSLRESCAQLLAQAGDLLGESSPLVGRLRGFVTRWADCASRTDELATSLRLDRTELPSAETYPGRWTKLLDRLDEHRSHLPNWCRYREALDRAHDAGMHPLLESLDKGSLPPENLPESATAAYYRTFLRRLLNLSPVLRDFWGDEQEKRIQAFQDLDQRYTALTAQIIRARLAGSLPRARGHDSPKNSELGILQRERAKKGRHKPVRRLLGEIPHLAPALKPCFLMSPLSVAQFLEPGGDPFDLVIFDEASQIPVWDAIGAIARGQQLIVVGDPKQLPPTNFFNREEDDTGIPAEEGIVDLESILDECLGSGLPTSYLQWHYRSRREGLIAFSNHHYYQNRLYTFPSPDRASPGVRLVHLSEGVYDKGKSRTNPAEAEAIKAEVIRRLTDPDQSNRSIGIVTFSQAQQTLVLDKMDEARREYPEIETFFDSNREEPVFVKNLENVQGDERDIILFSVCYGPDAAGKVSMNFGPLNRDGGERRLNVAITRAKEEVIVFSTLKGEQIDLTRTNAVGVAHLKFYLEYAERGPAAITAQISPGQADAYDSLFEKEVATFLRAEGFTVQTQVGCSGYRLDLALVDPEESGRYLLAVECDGATYHRSASARDRDRLRQLVLEGLGWRILRVWSTDWWRDRKQAGERLRHQINECLAQPRNSPKPPAPATEPPPPAPEASPSSGDTSPPPPAISPREEMYPLTPPDPQAPPERFYETSARPGLRARMEKIITTEGPITERLLFRRVLADWGFTRAGARIRSVLEAVRPSERIKTHRGEEPVYWPANLDPETFTIYRVPDPDSAERRALEEIPYRELENAVFGVLENYLALPGEDLLREVARRFGFTRLTRTAREHLEPVLPRLLESRRIILRGDTIRAANGEE